MDKRFERFIKEFIKKAGENLVSLILYGSAVNKILKPRNFNLMIILKSADPDVLISYRKIIKKYKYSLFIEPVFLTEEEILHSSDVFPIEHLEIKESYQVLAGKDIIKDLKIEDKNLRHQIEFEARSLLIRLRNVAVSENIKFLRKEFILKTIKTLSLLVKHSDSFIKDKFILSSQLIDIKKIDLKEKEKIFNLIIDETERFVKVVDKVDMD